MEWENQTGFEGPGRCNGIWNVWWILILNIMEEKLARVAHTMLHAKNCPAGKMTVAIDNGFGGVIFHEACGHSLEATAVAKGNSVFADMIRTTNCIN